TLAHDSSSLAQSGPSYMEKSHFRWTNFRGAGQLYVALGIFLLIASRNPSANCSLIAFTAWSSFSHAAVMAVTAFSKGGYRGDLWGVAVLVIIGVVLIALAPPKPSGERVSAAVV
ncbi:MAG: DUF6632 domain-containing protein, partial [Terriglobales bacterium]